MGLFLEVVLEEVIKIKWCHKYEALTNYNQCFDKKRKKSQGYMYTEKRLCEDTMKGVLSAKDRDLRRDQHVNTLILDIEPPELWENKFLLFMLPVFGNFLWQTWATNTKGLYYTLMQISRDIFHYHNSRGATGIWWLEARDADKYHTVHRAVPLPIPCTVPLPLLDTLAPVVN
jgi:hypothetical protein